MNIPPYICSHEAMKKLLSIGEAAKALGVTTTTMQLG